MRVPCIAFLLWRIGSGGQGGILRTLVLPSLRLLKNELLRCGIVRASPASGTRIGSSEFRLLTLKLNGKLVVLQCRERFLLSKGEEYGHGVLVLRGECKQATKLFELKAALMPSQVVSKDAIMVGIC